MRYPERVDKADAIAQAQQYAQSLGFGLLSVEKLSRGASWWVVALNGGPDLGPIVVEDRGVAHVEPVPFGDWFEDLSAA